MSEKITRFLIQNFYGCVRFPTNEGKLKEIIPQVAGETGVCIIRNGEEDLRITEKFLELKKKKGIQLITSREFISKKDEYFSHFSLVFIDNFQKSDLYTLSIINEWYRRFTGVSGDGKLPYLLLGSNVEYYPKIPLPLNSKKVLDLSPGSEVKPEVEYSDKNYDLNSKDLYLDLTSNILRDLEKVDMGTRFLVILPTKNHIDEMTKVINSKTYLEDVLVAESLFKKTKHKKKVVILTLDYSKSGVYYDDIHTVYDCGEIMRTYITKTGGNKMFIKKIDKEEMEERKMSLCDSKNYSVMFTKSSLKQMKTSTIPISYRSNLSPALLFLIEKEMDISHLPVKETLKELRTLNMISVDNKISEKGQFAMNFEMDIYNTNFLYYAIQNKLPLYPVTVLLSVFQRGVPEKDSRSFWEVFTSTTECDLAKKLEIDTSLVYNPEKFWNEIVDCIPKVYLGRVCRYEGGKYRDGYGRTWQIPHSARSGGVSKLILPLSRYKNEKGEWFTDFYAPLKKQFS